MVDLKTIMRSITEGIQEFKRGPQNYELKAMRKKNKVIRTKLSELRVNVENKERKKIKNRLMR